MHGALTLEVRRRITRCCCGAPAARPPAVASCISPFLQFLEVPRSHSPLQDFLLSMNRGKLPLQGQRVDSGGKRAAWRVWVLPNGALRLGPEYHRVPATSLSWPSGVFRGTQGYLGVQTGRAVAACSGAREARGAVAEPGWGSQQLLSEPRLLQPHSTGETINSAECFRLSKSYPNTNESAKLI